MTRPEDVQIHVAGRQLARATTAYVLDVHFAHVFGEYLITVERTQE